MDTKLQTIQTLISNLTSPSDQTRLAALRNLHLMSNQDPSSRPLITAAGATTLLADALYSLSHSVQEHAAATLLNLSISDRHSLISTRCLLDALSHVLSRHASTSSPSAVQSSAATFHSLLAVVAEYRPFVGARREILHALVGIIGSPNSPTKSVKDALKASFGIVLHPPNRVTMIRLGAVPALFGLVTKEKKRLIGMVEDITAVIAQIAGCEESEKAFKKVSGITVLMVLLDSDAETSSLRTKENAIAGLLNLVRYGGESVVREVSEKMIKAMDGIVCVQEHGSAKGKSKAVALMKLLLDGGYNGKKDEDLYPVESDL